MFMKIKLQEFTCIIKLKEVVIMTRVGMGIKKNNNNEAEKIKKIQKELETVKAEKENLTKELETVKAELAKENKK